jgi:hypothetical protein
MIIRKRYEDKEKLKNREFYKGITSKKRLIKFTADTIIQKTNKSTYKN